MDRPFPKVDAGTAAGESFPELFREQFHRIEAWCAASAGERQFKTVNGNTSPKWPAAGRRSLVIGREIAVELGHPDDGSVSFIIWRQSADDDAGGRIYLVGPDLPESAGRRLPFAKVVMIHGEGFNADNTYARYRQLEAVRYQIDLKGYMMRAVSQVNREWSRVSHEAIANGFGFGVLGGALINAFADLDYVRGVDVLFVTSKRSDVLAFQPLAQKVSQVIAAMNKMVETMDCDCSSCSYADVCKEVAGLRAVRRAMENRNG
jgi:CO dehydrogenase/acetyl-CoA synthase beta subunit